MSKTYTSAAYVHPALRDNPELMRQLIRSVLAGRPTTFTWKGRQYTVRRPSDPSAG